MKLFKDIRCTRRTLRNSFISVLLITFFTGSTVFSQDKGIRVMSFNIRLENPNDGINNWGNRKELLTESIINASPDIIGMQEVLSGQLKYLDENLPDFGYIGVGREDGKTGGEYVPVFYKLSRFGLLDNGTFWLSSTPGDTGSVGWDAALPRICTWGKFLDKTSGREFYFLNTHFDHMGKTARAESARLIVNFIKNQTNGLPSILSGDFNCSPEEEPYSVLTDPHGDLSDACLSSNSTKACNEGTFNGFGSEENPQRIDMVFVKGEWEVESYEVLKIKEGGVFVSDHWPVEAELKIKN